MLQLHDLIVHKTYDNFLVCVGRFVSLQEDTNEFSNKESIGEENKERKLSISTIE